MLAVEAQTVIGLRLMMLGSGGAAARAFVPRPDLEALVFDDLAINDSFELGSPRGSSDSNCGALREGTRVAWAFGAASH